MKIIYSSAPVRINDIGGWTDTWFAGKGKVLNLAVNPGIKVKIKIYENRERSKKRVTIYAVDLKESVVIDPGKPDYGSLPILQGAVSLLPVPRECRLDIYVSSSIPAASSVGTSASVCVALLGGLKRLSEQRVIPEEIAAAAHQVETEKLGLQSGIQDQIAAAYGGICFIHMPKYPEARVKKLYIDKSVKQRLNAGINLIYLGKSHSSSSLHETVINALGREGKQFEQVKKLRSLAEAAKTSLENGDLQAYGKVMIRNNECQRALHPELICEEANAVISLAEKYRAEGWKVNGAGGRGGSITLLGSPDAEERCKMLGEINTLGRGIRQIPVSLADSGLSVFCK